jgi:hypothetical protein
MRVSVTSFCEYDSILVIAYIGGSIQILCNKNFFGNDTNPSFFYGVANARWYLDGIGEAYPFDSYFLHFEFSQTSGSTTVISNETRVILYTAETIRDWDASISLIQDYKLNICLSRKPLIPFLQFLLPIIACYYLLGATLLLDIKEKLNERLGVYLSLFIFAPTFMFAIQQFLPLRLSLALPEFLLTNLLVSNAVFGICSMIGNRTTANTYYKIRENTIEGLNFASSVLSLIIFLILYLPTLFGRINVSGSLVSYFIIQSYTYWLFFKKPILEKKRKLYTFIGLLFFPIVLMLIIYWILLTIF